MREREDVVCRLIGWLNTCMAHISILSNAHGAWLMFWPVFRKCHTLRWEWSVLPLAHHTCFPFLRTLVHAGFCMLPLSQISVCFHYLVTYTRESHETAGCFYSACLMFWVHTHTGPSFIMWPEGRLSHQPQVFRALPMHSKSLSLMRLEPQTSCIESRCFQ
jgi:hypothetical protein